MHKVSKRVRFRALVQEGMSKTAISRELGIGRRTATRWAAADRVGRNGEALTYGPRPAVPSMLDPYKEIVRVRLSAYPELSAVRLFRELRASGYSGGYDVVKRYVRGVRPRPAREPVVRFETPPGRQGQVDFAHFRLPWGTRYALVVVLAFSRLLWFRFYERQTMGVLMRGLEEAFAYFGGVPWELLFDQLRAVDHRGPAGVVRDVAAEPGVRAVRAPPRVRDPGVPAVSGADEGEGGASDQLHPARVLLWAGVRVGRGPERPGVELAGQRGERAGARDADGGSAGPVRAGAAVVAPVGGAALCRCPAGLFGTSGGGAAAGGGGAPEPFGVWRGRGGWEMTSGSRHERISGQLVDLKMPGALEALDEVLRGVDSGSLTGSEAIEKLLRAQTRCGITGGWRRRCGRAGFRR